MDFWIFFEFFLDVFGFFLDFFVFLAFLSKLLRLLLNVTMVNTGHQKSPKMGQNSIISFFLPGQRPKPKPEPFAGVRSKPP